MAKSSLKVAKITQHVMRGDKKLCNFGLKCVLGKTKMIGVGKVFVEEEFEISSFCPIRDNVISGVCTRTLYACRFVCAARECADWRCAVGG